MEIFVAVILAIFLSTVSGTGYLEDLAPKRLVNTLLTSYGPTSMLPTKSVLRVIVRLKPNKLIALDEYAETLVLANYAKLQWRDEHLTWDPMNYSNVSKVDIYPRDIWTPDLALMNNVDVKFIRYPSGTSYKLNVNYDGIVTWFFPLITSSTCVPQNQYFPFDLQVCNLTFVSWTRDNRYIEIIGASDNDARQQIFVSNKVWDLVAFTVQNEIKHFANGANWSMLNYQISFQREPWFYLVTISFPCVLLSLILLAVFWLPHEAGEKIVMATESLVALILFQQLAGTVRPPSGNSLQMLDLYFITMIILSCTTIASSVLVRSLYFGKGSGLPHPFIRRIVHSWLCTAYVEIPQSVGLDAADGNVVSEEESQHNQGDLELAEKEWREDYERRKSCQVDNDNLCRRSKSGIGNRKKSKDLLDMYLILQKVTKQFSSVNQQQTEEKYKKEWKLVAVAIDRIAFALHLAAATGITIYVYIKIAFNHSVDSSESITL